MKNQIRHLLQLSLVFCIIGSATKNTAAQTFSTFIDLPTIEDYYDISMVWADFDSNGYKDLLYIRGDSTIILKNNGNGQFEKLHIDYIPGHYSCQINTSDVDNDGDIDILITGNHCNLCTFYSSLYINNGSFTFSEADNPNIPDLGFGMADFVDVNHDGLKDLLIQGIGGNGASACMLNNAEAFNEFSYFNLTDFYATSGAGWFDFQNDGDQDLLVSKSEEVILYVNNGSGNFHSIPLIDFPKFENGGDIIAFDYDNDDIDDVFVIGSLDNTFISKFYKILPDGTFIPGPDLDLGYLYYLSGLPACVSTGDYDHDGYLDLLLSASVTGTSRSRIIHNNGDGTFTPQTQLSIPGIEIGEVQWIDYDEDGDLDVSVIGYTTDFIYPDEYFARIYINDINTTNLRPSIPSDLSHEIYGKNVVFSWNAPYDDHSQNTLRYNLKIGTSPGASDILCPETNTTSGKLKTYNKALSDDENYFIRNLDYGTYYWSVQAIDGANQGSLFSSEKQFTVAPELKDVGLTNLPDYLMADPVLIDYNNDGITDILVPGRYGSDFSTSILKGSGDMQFQKVAIDGLNNKYYEDFEVTDINNDNNPDILVYENGAVYTCTNDGTNFSVKEAISLTGYNDCTFRSGDIDNDGYTDIVGHLGSNSGGELSTFYNDGQGNFTGFSTIETDGLFNYLELVNDFDNDDHLDAIVITDDFPLMSVSIAWNDNGFGFEELISMYSAEYLIIDFVFPFDIDSDGNLDILIGIRGVSANMLALMNDGNRNFLVRETPVFSDMQIENIHSLDINNDGLSDLILAAREGSEMNREWVSESIFLNNAKNGFERYRSVVPEYTTLEHFKSGHINNDNAPDLIIGGYFDGDYEVRLYESLVTAVNNSPNTPAGLISSTVFEDNVPHTKLRWREASDDKTPAELLNYNIRVGTSSGETDVFSPLSSLSGTRKNQDDGNAGIDESFELTGLQPGTYYWSVQAVDNAGNGSVFAPEQSFTVGSLDFTLNDSDIPAALYANAQFGDIDNDNDLDIVLIGRIQHDDQAQIYINTGNGNYLLDDQISLPYLSYRINLLLFDADNDNDIDMFLGGEYYDEPLYINNGQGKFESVETDISGTYYGNYAAGDYNNDGKTDILSLHLNDIALLENSGDYEFDISQNANLGWVIYGDAEWADLNNDSYADLVVSGDNKNVTVYLNNRGTGDDIFTSIELPIEMIHSDISIIDVNNDGFRDISLIGESEGKPSSAIFKNLDGNSFIENDENPIPPVYKGDHKWIDYNTDGMYDILYCGLDTAENPLSSILSMKSGLLPTESDYGVSQIYSGIITAGDVDNDNDLDVIFAGNTSKYGSISELLVNNSLGVNLNPTAPTNLNFEQWDNLSIFTWNAGSDDISSSSQLSYNIRIGTSPGGTDIVSPSSDVETGFRKIPVVGNAYYNQKYILKDLKPGAYYWSVQTIDHTMNGSEFADEQLATASAVIDDETRRGIRLYPNPAREYIMVGGMISGDFLIYNVTGTIVSHGSIVRGGNNMITTEKFPPGVYTLEISGSEDAQRSLFIIE